MHFKYLKINCHFCYILKAGIMHFGPDVRAKVFTIYADKKVRVFVCPNRVYLINQIKCRCNDA